MTILAVLVFAVTLAWHDNSNNENGFVVEKTVSGNCTNGFEVLAFLGVNVTSFVDNMGAPGNCYRVDAFNDAGVSAYSNTAQVAQSQPPPTEPPPCATKGKSKKCR